MAATSSSASTLSGFSVTDTPQSMTATPQVIAKPLPGQEMAFTPQANPFAFPIGTGGSPSLLKRGGGVGGVGGGAATGGTAASEASTSREVDVSKMDSSSLQDVMQYAGVDLREETELMMRSAEQATSGEVRGGGPLYRQQQLHHQQQHQQMMAAMVAAEHTLVSPVLAQTVARVAKAEGGGAGGGLNVDPSVVHYVSLALMERLRYWIEKSVRASKARVEAGRDTWQLEVIDGEEAVCGVDGTGGAGGMGAVPPGYRSRVGAVKRPLVWLERSEREREISASKMLSGSLTEEGRQALVEAGISVDHHDDDKKKGGGASGGGGRRGGGGDEVLSREDLAVRTRMANVAAMKAAGSSSKYSWMASSSGAGGGASGAGAGGGTTGDPGGKKASTADSMTGGFGLPRPSVRRRILNARRVSLRDLLFVLQHDRSRGGSWGIVRRTPAVAKALCLRLNDDR